MADSMLPKPFSQRMKDWANNVTPGSPQDNRLAKRPSRKRSYNEFAASEQASEVSMDSGATNRGLSTSQRLKILLEANLFRLRTYGIYDMWHIDKKPMSAMTELENALLLTNQKAQEEVRKNQRSTTNRAAQFMTQWTAVARHMATVREMMSGQGSIMPQLEEVNVHLRRATHWGVEIAFVSYGLPLTRSSADTSGVPS
ncbi:hypothetical protein P170DRAFT_428581 [Aspergillus steynii IBT 23096]|uniref:Uncharacterized protein n=1 Tax=Aspergillus steynii IBT 23096 TaxID=1392250 RepID=A0A2I2G3F1_9EURO|nr:uncharacterized protein P170DRAFT_428581 [Aspergillus steynii IBT 23096]PLB47403.1 hypothetical protein P170DRAFT_428581 [Aspergillus steynii IBT 23096]